MFARTIKLSHLLIEVNSNRHLVQQLGLLKGHIRYSYGSSGSCWKCGAKSSLIFCHQCNSLQKPIKNINYFNLFGLTQSFDLQTTNLAKEYRKLQSLLHPDKFANASQDERTISEEYSSVINKAYSTLQQPLTRGLYLLELNGIYLEEGNVESDPEFLMDLMERNEEVDQVASDLDVKKVSNKNHLALSALIRNASEAFRSGDLKKAKAAIIKLKYFASIEEKIKVLKMKRGYIE